MPQQLLGAQTRTEASEVPRNKEKWGWLGRGLARTLTVDPSRSASSILIGSSFPGFQLSSLATPPEDACPGLSRGPLHVEETGLVIQDWPTLEVN